MFLYRADTPIAIAVCGGRHGSVLSVVRAPLRQFVFSLHKKEMNCTLSGIIGLGMLGATFATMSVTEEQHSILRKKLSDELDQIYDKIAIERRNLYFQGIILGLLIAYFSLNLFKTVNRFHRITFVLAISLPISVLYYFLMPKSDYMLNHLKTPEQNKAWLEIYKTMQMRYIVGFIFGTIAAVPIAYSMC